MEGGEYDDDDEDEVRLVRFGINSNRMYDYDDWEDYSIEKAVDGDYDWDKMVVVVD